MKYLTVMVLGLICFFQNAKIYSQQDNKAMKCSKENVYGKWDVVTSILEYEPIQLDLLLQEIDTMSSKDIGLIIENEEFLTIHAKKQKSYSYTLDESTCKVDQRKKKESKQYTQKEIVYLSEEYLIMRQPNPHAPTIVVYRKRKTA